MIHNPRSHIGYTSPYLPPEIIWACGLTPVRLRPGASLAAAGASLAAADGYLPRNFSVEARALFAAALEGDPSACDAVIFLDEDDTSRRLYDLWRAHVEIPALGLVPLPRLDTPLTHRYFASALAELAASLTALSGQPLTADRLRRAIDLYNEQRALWRRLRQCWVDGGLSTGDWYDLRWLALTSDPEAANAEFAACLQRNPSSGAGSDGRGVEDRGVRLLILGGMEVPRRFLTFLEEGCDALVVAEDSEADERTLTEPILIEDNSPSRDLRGRPKALEALAAAYLAKPPGPRPNALSDRLAGLARLLDERGVQGVVAFYPKFADAYLAEYLALSELFHARGWPTLLLEDDGESGFSGQQRTRVEAFLEMLA